MTDDRQWIETPVTRHLESILTTELRHPPRTSGDPRWVHIRSSWEHLSRLHDALGNFRRTDVCLRHMQIMPAQASRILASGGSKKSFDDAILRFVYHKHPDWVDNWENATPDERRAVDCKTGDLAAIGSDAIALVLTMVGTDGIAGLFAVIGLGTGAVNFKRCLNQ